MGLGECLALGWLWRIDTLRRHANSRSDWRLGRWWDYLIRLIIPVVLGALFFWQLFDDFTSESGFLRSPDDEWIVSNCVGFGVVIGAIIAAAIIGILKGRSDVDVSRMGEQQLATQGRVPGICAFGAASLCLLVLAGMVLSGRAPRPVLLVLPAAGGAVAMLLGNVVLDRCHTASSQASWFARWAGIVGILDVSSCIAMALIWVTRTRDEETFAGEHLVRTELSGVSYVILAVVFLIIVGGLGWCFYRAISAAGAEEPQQLPDEIGDEATQL
jgi:NSS family neurotransmitter:Na+ symporter